MQTVQKYQKVADRLARLSESQTLAMSKKARELAQKGIPVINLSIGEPDFNTPAHIKEAAKKAIDDNFTFYPPVSGIPELRTAIAEKLRKENGLKWEAANIVVSTGAKQSLANVFLSLLNPGDEVIILAPYWVSYSEIVKLAEGEPVILEGRLEDNFKVTPEQLAGAVSPKTRAILYSSPSNPTGTVYSKEELRALADVIAPYEQIFVVADEIYEYINFGKDYFSMGAFEDIAERVVTVNGFSKGFAMTGWRLGYVAAARWIADACEKIQGQVTSGACSIAQKAALAAVTGDLTPTREMCEAYRKRRDIIVELMSKIEGVKTYVPDGAFYLLPDVSHYFGKRDGDTLIKNATDLCLYLLKEGHVSLVPGEAFGAPHCIRLSYAASEENIREAVRRIEQQFKKLV